MRLFAYHTRDSRGCTPGFPDLVIIGARTVLWRELKTAKGRLTFAQLDVLTRLRAAGQDANVWRPADWFSGRIEKQLRAAARGKKLS